MSKHAPLTTCFQDIQNRIDDATFAMNTFGHAGGGTFKKKESFSNKEEQVSHRKELTYSGFQPPFVIPPVQIRTCAANASGSCFESDAQTLPFGAPCLNRSLILPASEFRTQEGKQNSSQPSPFAPQAPLISFALLLYKRSHCSPLHRYYELVRLPEDVDIGVIY